MAETIATITGTALLPGVSANKRWYKPEHVAEAVKRAQERIKAGSKPMVMLTFHGADDRSREIAASLTDVSLNESGGMDFAAGFANTPAGWDIAHLADTSDGRPAHLKNVSIRGSWVGRVRKERGPTGELCETADGVDLDGVDFTRSPGVSGAEIKTFDWVKGGANETTERVLITESVQEACVTAITEEAPPEPPEGVQEALRALFGEPVTEAATPAVSKRGTGTSDDAGRSFADPGYQSDKKQRYDLSTKAKAKAAWSYVSQPGNAKAYTPAQLKRVKGQIKAALGKFGVTVAAEGWTVDPALLLTEAVAEYAGMDPECAGSYSLSATNGPTTVTVCSYGLDPADLSVILAKACAGAGMALSALDPDMDGDIEMPGDGAENAPEPEAPADEADEEAPAVTETAPTEDPAPEPAADREETEAPAMSETTTETVAPAPAAASAVSVPEDLVQKYMNKLAKKEAARRIAAGAPAESAPAAAVTESDDERVNRIVSERLAAERAAAAVTETDEQRISRLVEEKLVRERQDITASGGGPGRKGLVAEHAGAAGGGPDAGDLPLRNGALIPMEEWTEEQNRAVGAQWEKHVLGSRASL